MSMDGPVLVDWFDACRGDPVADVARSSLTLLPDGAATPSHLPGSDRKTLAVLTQGYLTRLRESLDIPPDLLARWQAVNAAARLAEGMPRRPLLEVWRRSAWAGARPDEPQAAVG